MLTVSDVCDTIWLKCEPSLGRGTQKVSSVHDDHDEQLGESLTQVFQRKLSRPSLAQRDGCLWQVSDVDCSTQPGRRSGQNDPALGRLFRCSPLARSLQVRFRSVVFLSCCLWFDLHDVLRIQCKVVLSAGLPADVSYSWRRVFNFVWT